MKERSGCWVIGCGLGRNLEEFGGGRRSEGWEKELDFFRGRKRDSRLNSHTLSLWFSQFWPKVGKEKAEGWF